MALELTARAAREAERLNIQPQLVIEIEGVATVFGAVELLRYIRIGDPELYIGDDWVIGGLTSVEDQEDILSLETGTGNRIDQQLHPDKGSVSSIASIQIALTDRRLIMSRLISPGVTIEEILGTKAHLWIGFKNTAWKEDFVRLFSGVIDEVESGPGQILLTIAHAEQLKRQKIYTPQTVQLASAIDASVTTVPLLSSAGVQVPVLGPDGVTYDSAIRYYARFEDEIIRYTGVTGNNLTGCTRGALASFAAAHDSLTDGKTLVSIEDTAVNCALKIMLSGRNGAFVSAIPATRYLHPTPLETIANSIFFEGVDLFDQYGLTAGDYVTVTGATAGANDCANKAILEVVKNDEGSYIVVDGVSFVEELTTSAVAAFRSRYDTLGEGLNLTPDQVDVTEHVFWNDFQLAASSYRFVLQDSIEGKKFLDEQIYLPLGAYSIPRKGRCSMGFHVGPAARGTPKILNRDVIKSPDKIKLKRGIGRNFYNTVVYRFDQDAVNDKFASGVVQISGDSKTRIPVGNKVLSVTALGLRRDLDGAGLARRTADRYLGRYRFAAEYFENIGVFFKAGFSVEPGDMVIVEFDGLKVTNTQDGTRDKQTKVYEVTNRKVDLKTGDVTLSLLDTNYDLSEKYGVISPSSRIVSATVTSLEIEDSFGALFPTKEFKKWADYAGLPLVVHSDDWTYEEETTLVGVDPGDDSKLLVAELPSAPPAGSIVDIGPYPVSADPAFAELYKAVHAFLGASVAIVSGIDASSFTVSAPDASKFIARDVTRVHNEDFTVDSGEVEILSVVGVTITTEPLGFTPTTSERADSMGFIDGTPTYRFF